MRFLSFFFLLSLSLLLSCGEKKAAKPAQQRGAQAVPVSVTTVVKQDLVFYDEYPGRVAALDQVELRPQLAGYITKVHYEEGSFVRNGQKLYTIDNRPYQADVRQAEAGIRTAEANLKVARKDVERYRRLIEQEAIAQQTLEQAEARLESLNQELAAAKARLESASTQLDYTVVRAPMSGTSGLNGVKVGTQVSPGAPVLNIISRQDPIGIDFALPQERIGRMVELQEMNRNELDSTFQLRLPDGSLYPSFGKIHAIDRAVDPRTGTLTVRLSFANEKGILRPGMNVLAEVLNESAGPQLLIPSKALSEQMGEFFVFQRRDSIVTREKVQVGAKFKGKILIKAGLQAGDVIVTEGIKQLRDSSKIKVSQADNSISKSELAKRK